MNHSCLLLFPHQLFDQPPGLDRSRPIFIIEDTLFFGDPIYPARFHLQKLLYHRLTIQAHEKNLQERGYLVEILPYASDHPIQIWIQKLIQRKYTEFHWIDPDDFILSKRLHEITKKNKVKTTIHPSPLFLTPLDDGNQYFDHEKRYFMANFYIFQRKRLGILIDRNQKPLGGKWSFDAENRKKLPRDISIPTPPLFPLQPNEKKIALQIQKQFPQSVGLLSETRPPLHRDEAYKSFEDFLIHRFARFGEYEDAIHSHQTILFHSQLTPALNIGLITPQEIITRTLEFAKSEKIPLNSLEGFIRQIIGWREFIRLLYRREGVTMRNRNFFENHLEIPDSFYTGTTGIPIIDRTIHRLQKQAYCHHIERLMVLGNFMLLAGFHPHHVYRWFMEFFIDSYDWVMVPNVYGMSQFADGGIFATKPYISSSNYILKMSDEKKGDWCATWDGLFWRFIHRHRQFFESNFRLSMMVKQLDRMETSKLKSHLQNAERFINS